MKRSKYLLTLSHEHHHGLIFCMRLKKGHLASQAILQDYIRDFWERSLKNHFLLEDQLFLPLLSDDAITKQYHSEHRQIRLLVAEILASEKNIHDKAAELGKLINNHIRFEERVFFPYLEDQLITADLEMIEKKLNEIKIEAHDFPIAFWKE